MHNDKAFVSGAALKKLNLNRQPDNILEQMHHVNCTGRSDAEIIDIIMKARGRAEKCEESKQNLSLMKSVSDVRKETKT